MPGERGNARGAPAGTDAGRVAALVPAFDFKAVAALCTELSRVDDTMALPPLLERAATLLDAAGIILWIADPDGRELNPVLAQGYPAASRSTASARSRAAPRTRPPRRSGPALLQTVYADGSVERRDCRTARHRAAAASA